MQTKYFYRYTCLDQSINLCVLSDKCYELFCVFGDFCAAGTQEGEVPKSPVKIYLSWGKNLFRESVSGIEIEEAVNKSVTFCSVPFIYLLKDNSQVRPFS